ncbi:uncharacterized protein KY384_007761 [Bacidia gigantensis]|uniref:uncharacterized protein n=1 Tax=Bacidia gigantensis TaxID=2732470 RepID=UPI001D03E080|nr:uncharacterized protein KY384_007761 [Bacidia gigantensis]KAG8527608.1 hypothetical protein KY384_007761 [Bacidia gigantensis]
MDALRLHSSSVQRAQIFSQIYKPWWSEIHLLVLAMMDRLMEVVLVKKVKTQRIHFSRRLSSGNAAFKLEDLPVEEAEGKVPMLAIWGLALLHQSTTEDSAQGLSRTLASAVEAAHFARQRLTLAENPVELGAHDNENYAESGNDHWRRQLPLLSGSVRVEGGHRLLSEHSIEIGAVIGKWCRFVEF